MAATLDNSLVAGSFDNTVDHDHALRKGSVVRMYHHDGNAKYVLPNDSSEHFRLEEQAYRIQSLMKGRVIHAPLQDLANQQLRTLDVGCGTGPVTRLIASSFPNAECIGLDLSAIPEEIRAQAPDNVRFLQGNVRSETPSQWKAISQDKALEQDSELFDYIYSRLLILGMTDWDGHVRTIFDLLKPGGCMEMHDLDWDYFDESGIVSEDWQWLNSLKEVCEGEKDMDFRCGSNAAKRMKQVGFEDVQVFKYVWPYGGDLETDPREREFSRWLCHSQPDMINRMIKRTMMEDSSQSHQVSEETVEQMRSEMRRCLMPRRGLYMLFSVTIGRKPVG